jgi:hypothetical protein
MESPGRSSFTPRSSSEESPKRRISNKKLDTKLPKIPGEIQIEESENGGTVDIVKLHKSILSLFKKTKKKRIEEIDNKLDCLKNLETITAIEKDRKKKDTEKWKKIRKMVEIGEDVEIFLYQGNNILEKYSKIIEKDDMERESIILEYLDFARNVINIEQKSTADEISVDIISSGSNGKPGKEDDKTEKDNFHKAFLSHQAKRTINIPEGVFERLDDYFGSFDHLEHLIRDNIHKVKLLKNGKRKGTSKELMRDALSATGNASYYDRENIICTVYWKWKLKDLSHIEMQVMVDFDETQKVYRWMKDTKHPLLNRKSNLNVGYRLYQHLRARGIICNKKDFKIIGGRDILIDYDQIWDVMVEKANIELKKLGYEPMIFLPTV